MAWCEPPGARTLQGPQISTESEDYLHCTPEGLAKVVDSVLGAYDSQKGRATMTGDAAALMTPEVIERLRVVQLEIRKNFL